MNNVFNITNSFEHPTRPGYMVFKFRDIERVKLFENYLKSEKIWFEKGEEKLNDTLFYFFGVKNNDFSKANKLNYIVTAHFRNKFIPNKYYRWGLIIITFGLITMAIIGYLESKP